MKTTCKKTKSKMKPLKLANINDTRLSKNVILSVTFWSCKIYIEHNIIN